MDRKHAISVLLVILLVAASGAAYYFGAGGRSAKPLLKIGSLNYVQGGSLITVCRNGKVFDGPYTPSADQPANYRYAAKLDSGTMDKVRASLGSGSFKYYRSYRVPGAADGDFEVTAEYDAGAQTAEPTDQDIDNYRGLIETLALNHSVMDRSGQPLILKASPLRGVCAAQVPPGGAVVGPTGDDAAIVWPASPGSAPQAKAEVSFGETFFLNKAGDETRIKGQDIKIRATKISEYCPGAADQGSAAGQPGSCATPKTGYVEEYEIVIDGRTFNGRDYRAKPGDRIKLQIIHPDLSGLFRVYDLEFKCAGTTGQENVYCWDSVAYDSGMAEWCDKITYEAPEAAGLVTAESARDACREMVAVRRGLESACLLIQDAGRRDRCYETLAWNKPELCGLVRDPKAYCSCGRKSGPDRNLCLEQVIGADPALANNWNLCNGLQPLRGACLHIEALRTEDIGLCSGIVIYKEEVNCYLDLLRRNRSFEDRPQGLALCDALSGEKKERCISVINKEGLLNK